MRGLGQHFERLGRRDGHAIDAEAHRGLRQILGMVGKIDAGADHHHRAVLGRAADILEQHAGDLLAREQDIVRPFQQKLGAALIGDQLGDGIEGDDAGDERELARHADAGS